MSQAGLGPAGRSLSRPLSVRAVLFDLDGTLVDSAPDLTVATNKMLSALGYPHVNCTQVKGWVGDGARLPNSCACGLHVVRGRVDRMRDVI